MSRSWNDLKLKRNPSVPNPRCNKGRRSVGKSILYLNCKAARKMIWSWTWKMQELKSLTSNTLNYKQLMHPSARAVRTRSIFNPKYLVAVVPISWNQGVCYPGATWTVPYRELFPARTLASSFRD